MAYRTLEDFFGDIVGKARRGQGISESELAQQVGLSVREIGQIESYELTLDDQTICRLADTLHLNGEKLVEVARGWVPAQGNAAFEDENMRVDRLILDAGMTVNCYVLICKTSSKGAVIDPGGQAQLILDAIADVQVTHILLTHGHGDHVGALEAVADATQAQVCGCDRDFALMGGRSQRVTERVDEGWQTAVGELGIDTVSLPGHTGGGIGYYTAPVFFSGDALFAGSLGGARGDAYRGQIQAVRAKVLSLPEETTIFPGHGPITSVVQELAHNPYFV